MTHRHTAARGPDGTSRRAEHADAGRLQLPRDAARPLHGTGAAGRSAADPPDGLLQGARHGAVVLGRRRTRPGPRSSRPRVRRAAGRPCPVTRTPWWRPPPCAPRRTTGARGRPTGHWRRASGGRRGSRPGRRVGGRVRPLRRSSGDRQTRAVASERPATASHRPPTGGPWRLSPRRGGLRATRRIRGVREGRRPSTRGAVRTRPGVVPAGVRDARGGDARDEPGLACPVRRGPSAGRW
jgi:hypothetical protein